MRQKKNNKIAKITASAILLLTTNSLTSYAVNKSEYLVADTTKYSVLTKQVADDNIKPLNDGTIPKPLPIENPPAPPPQTKPVAPGRQPEDCGYWVWNRRRRRWVYVDIEDCGKKPGRKPNTCGYLVWNPKISKWVYFNKKCEKPPEIPRCGYWIWHPRLKRWVYVNKLCRNKPRLLEENQSTNDLEKEPVNVEK